MMFNDSSLARSADCLALEVSVISYYLSEFAEVFSTCPHSEYFFSQNRIELVPNSFPQVSVEEKKRTNEIFESVKKILRRKRSLRSLYMTLR